MDLKNSIDSQLEMSRNANSMQGIDMLRQAAQSGDKKALKEAASQFEAIFVQMMLKSMRKSQDALADKDSPFNSEQVKFYRDMHDQQLAVDLAAKGSIGIANLIVQQLSPSSVGFTPASVIRDNANLDGMVRQASVAQRDVVQTENGNTPQTDSAQQSASKRSAFASPGDFIKTLLPHAEQFAQQLGIDAKALLAQAAVETGWGRFMIHDANGQNSHNLFGIKADNRWQGDSASIQTLEFEQGVAKRQKANFRTYESFTDGLKDYISFVSENPRYKQALQNVTDPKAYFGALQEAGYATDPNYANKIMSVLNSDTFKSALGLIDGQ